MWKPSMPCLENESLSMKKRGPDEVFFPGLFSVRTRLCD